MAKIGSLTRQRLFALLRLALTDSDYSRTLFDRMDDNHWQDIYNAALEQGVLAFAYDGIRALDVEQQPSLEIKIQWAYNVSYIEKLCAKQFSTAQKVVDTFAKEGIKTLILKGLSLATLYPQPNHRQSGDIDVYLMGDFERGNEIMASRGTEVKYDYFVHSEFAVDGVNVENHKFFVNPTVNRTGEYIERVLEQMVAQSKTHPAVKGALIPSAEFAALFLARHSSWHYAREGIKLRDICDWGVFLNHYRDSIECNIVMEHLENSGLARYASILTTIAEQILGIKLPLEFSDRYIELSERVLEDILSFENEEKHSKMNFLRAFMLKTRNRYARKWCYDKVVPDSYWGNIWYSIKGYLTNPRAIKKAKL